MRLSWEYCLPGLKLWDERSMLLRRRRPNLTIEPMNGQLNPTIGDPGHVKSYWRRSKTWAGGQASSTQMSTINFVSGHIKILGYWGPMRFHSMSDIIWNPSPLAISDWEKLRAANQIDNILKKLQSGYEALTAMQADGAVGQSCPYCSSTFINYFTWYNYRYAWYLQYIYIIYKTPAHTGKLQHVCVYKSCTIVIIAHWGWMKTMWRPKRSRLPSWMLPWTMQLFVPRFQAELWFWSMFFYCSPYLSLPLSCFLWIVN